MTIAVLRQVSDGEGNRLGAHVLVWCPGCAEERDGFGLHAISVVGDDGSEPKTKWEWNESLEKPTFNPSYLTWSGDRDNPTTRCHSYLRDGRWEYLNDCTHSLADQTRDLPELPDWVTHE